MPRCWTLLSGLIGPNAVRADMATTSKGDASTMRILLNGGDNMLGRAVQLSFPVQSEGEELIRDSCTASHYVDMCLHPTGHQKDLSLREIRESNQRGRYLWGSYRDLIISPPPDLRILNLETAVTRSIHNKDVPMWKGIRYHLHVDNLESAMQGYAEVSHGRGNTPSPVVLSYANNHCMDYGRKAFEEETMPALSASSHFDVVGSGMDWSDATKPAVVNCGDKAIAEVFALSTGCSGTPDDWHATKSRSGLVGLPGLYDLRSVEKAKIITKEVLKSHRILRKPIRIFSVHWGPNWSRLPNGGRSSEGEEQIAARRHFAHWLIDECGADVIYGHSSHHARGMELYKGKAILYGTGDLINDYEGFENIGEERYNKLGGLYIVDVDANKGDLKQLRVVPMFMNRLRLERYVKSSAIWKPNKKRMEVNASKSEDFCRFINELSVQDSGVTMSHPSVGDTSALLLEHFDADPDIPGGPVLRTKLYGGHE